MPVQWQRSNRAGYGQAMGRALASLAPCHFLTYRLQSSAGCTPLPSFLVSLLLQAIVTEVSRRKLVFARLNLPTYRGFNKTFATPDALPSNMSGLAPVGGASLPLVRAP